MGEAKLNVGRQGEQNPDGRTVGHNGVEYVKLIVIVACLEISRKYNVRSAVHVHLSGPESGDALTNLNNERGTSTSPVSCQSPESRFGDTGWASLLHPSPLCGSTQDPA